MKFCQKKVGLSSLPDGTLKLTFKALPEGGLEAIEVAGTGELRDFGECFNAVLPATTAYHLLLSAVSEDFVEDKTLELEPGSKVSLRELF